MLEAASFGIALVGLIVAIASLVTKDGGSKTVRYTIGFLGLATAVLFGFLGFSAVLPNFVTPTPLAPTAIVDADPTMYDNFNNPAFDGKVNTSLWSPVVKSPNFVEQQNGIMTLSIAPNADKITSLFATSAVPRI